MTVQPLITIGIPTYNRSAYLKENLKTIYEQIGNDPDFEILVINNASDDDTEEIILHFKKQYNNLTYIKNDSNIGADRNIFKVIDEARGIYCLWHSDDDYFYPDALPRIKAIINQYRQCAVLFIRQIYQEAEATLYSGMSEFLRQTSYGATGISSIILEKKAFSQIREPQKFIKTSINHMYLIYSILEKNPLFVMINRKYIRLMGAKSTSYNWGKFIIKDYLDILYYFNQYGLNSKFIKEEKKKLLDGAIVPWYKKLQDPRWNIDLSDTIKYFVQYYKDEPYFLEYYDVLVNIHS
nr:glycosyltransferase family A protein [uncultured Cellulosilyticum sp.]